jgi:ubiquinone/menaquinone biosynthesis C-methylase UbiE
VARYTGLDLSAQALAVARSLGMARASYVQADGTKLPFRDGVFGAAVSYDVFTNLPDHAVALEMIAEMARVVSPGGRVLVGSLADEARKAEFTAVVERVGRELTERFGPLRGKPAARHRWPSWRRRQPVPEPAISCYYFDREELVRTGRRLGLEAQVHEVHPRNPYLGYRFNVVYRRPAPVRP